MKRHKLENYAESCLTIGAEGGRQAMLDPALHREQLQGHRVLLKQKTPRIVGATMEVLGSVA